MNEQKQKVEKELARLSKTQSIEEKVRYLTRILEEAKRDSEIEISNEITIECNKKLKEMALSNPLFVNSINENIKLENMEGVDQSEGSTGQEARIGIIFLLTILERSSIKFPLILDVPVKGMDFDARLRTAQFISKLDSQFIGFVIDSDKEHVTSLVWGKKIHFKVLPCKTNIDKKYHHVVCDINNKQDYKKIKEFIKEKKITYKDNSKKISKLFSL